MFFLYDLLSMPHNINAILHACHLCMFIVIYVFLLLCLCILIVCFCIFHRATWLSSATLTEVFPCFFLSCKAIARVKTAKTGHGPHSSKIFELFYVLFVLCRSVHCVRVCV